MLFFFSWISMKEGFMLLYGLAPLDFLLKMISWYVKKTAYSLLKEDLKLFHGRRASDLVWKETYDLHGHLARKKNSWFLLKRCYGLLWKNIS